MPSPSKAKPRPDAAPRRKRDAVVASQLPSPVAPDTAAHGAAYAPALNAGLQATTNRVQEMHQTIAGHTFDTLLNIPGLATPTRIVQGVHDAITQGVYAAVRHGANATLSLADGGERLGSPGRVPGAKEQTFRSVLNAAFGDTLDTMSNPLAIRMGLHANGKPITLDPEVLTGLQSKVLVFIHGLGCDERSWIGRPQTWADAAEPAAAKPGVPLDYGAMLERDLPVSAVYLRYNTGLALDANGEALAELLAQLVAAAPHVRELVLIGHSMGGLVARQALAVATERRMAWSPMVRLLICLGSPHQGAPLERLGTLTSKALGMTKTTQPLAHIANARSVGIKDLGDGLKRKKGAGTLAASPLAIKLVFATLVDEADTVLGPWIGKMLGDGLVQTPSASDEGLTGDVERCELPGLGHMALLSHPRVYALIRRWLGPPKSTPSARR